MKRYRLQLLSLDESMLPQEELKGWEATLFGREKLSKTSGKREQTCAS